MEKPNLTYIYSISKGDKAFEKQLLILLKKEFKEEKSAYEKGVKDKNFSLSLTNVHKLKHKIGILGLTEGHQVANSFEEHLMKKSFKFHQAFEAVLEIMEQYLEQI